MVNGRPQKGSKRQGENPQTLENHRASTRKRGFSVHLSPGTVLTPALERLVMAARDAMERRIGRKALAGDEPGNEEGG